jgi:monofunctional biosynthetic peptidoglycan transglycosylase
MSPDEEEPGQEPEQTPADESGREEPVDASAAPEAGEAMAPEPPAEIEATEAPADAPADADPADDRADAPQEDVTGDAAADEAAYDPGEELYEPAPTRARAPEPEPEPVVEDEPAQYQPQARQAPETTDEYMFGAPDIPMPAPQRRTDKQRARDTRANLDLDLRRIKRSKRFGLLFTTITVLFVAFVLAPVTWVGAYAFFDPPSNVLMLQRAAEGETIRHHPVPINRMSPHIVRAVIAAEDANVCTHDGFDVEAIQNAMERNARGGRVRGASTISQQTAKNLFLWPERSWLRKGLETYFTALIEFMWPKRRIMEAYLNTAEWGDGNFGVEAAARSHFGVSAADLTPLQAARLAAVLPNPNRWRADQPGPYVRQRSAMLVGRARTVRSERMAACVLYLDRPQP